MGAFFVYIVKSAVCFLLLYLPYRLLLRKETFSNFNRWVLLGIVLLSFLCPLCSISLPMSIHNEQLEDWIQQLSVVQISDVGNASTEGVDWLSWLCLIYLLGVGISLICKLIDFVRLSHFLSKGVVQEYWKGEAIVQTYKENIAPCSWMHIIMMSEFDYERNRQAILLHEWAHVSYGHSWDLLLIGITQVLQWFNPFVRLLINDLCDVHEYQADRAVLKSGNLSSKEYQMLLIQKAVGGTSLTLVNGLNRSVLKKRIAMMLSPDSTPWSRVKYVSLFPAFAIALWACQQQTPVLPTLLPEDDEKIIVKYVSEENNESAMLLIDNPLSVKSKRENKPLLIVDGKEVNSIENIHPENIDHINVIKDKSAMQYYGEKGKNGVILISLK